MKTVHSHGRYIASCAIIALCCWNLVLAQLPMGNPANFFYNGTSFCQNAPNVTPAATNVGVFSEATGNIVFVNNVTGELNLALCQPGTWTIKHVVFPDSTTNMVTILAADDPRFTFLRDTFCIGVDSIWMPVVLGLGGGTFAAAPSGIVLDSTTGGVDITASTPGTYIISYETQGQCPEVGFDTLEIGIVEDPSFSYPSYDVCAQGTLPATVATSGGSFTVMPSGLSINPTTGEVTLALSSSGIYTVHHQLRGACPTDFERTLEVTEPFVGALFAFIPDSICATDAIQYPVVLGPSPLTFTGSANVVFDSVALGSITPAAMPAGGHTITATATGVCAETWTATVFVLDSAQLTLVESGDTLFAPTAGSNFIWYLNGAPISGATDNFYIPTTDGNYEVRYADGCGVIASGMFVGIGAGHDGFADSRVYPNPSNGLVRYDITLARGSRVEWELIGALGNRLVKGDLGHADRDFHGALDFSALPDGTYLLRFHSAHGSTTQKLVLMH